VCGNPIPFQKYVLLANWSTITCPKCGSRLKANRKINSLIGGIGGGAGAIIGTWLIRTFSLYAWISLITWIIAVILAMRLLTKLELAETT